MENKDIPKILITIKLILGECILLRMYSMKHDNHVPRSQHIKICPFYFHVLKHVFKFYCNLYVQF
jgi:hypothetical protein